MLPDPNNEGSDWITGIKTFGWSGGFNVSPPPAGISSRGGGVESFFPLSAISHSVFRTTRHWWNSFVIENPNSRKHAISIFYMFYYTRNFLIELKFLCKTEKAHRRHYRCSFLLVLRFWRWKTHKTSTVNNMGLVMMMMKIQRRKRRKRKLHVFDF